MRRKMIVLMVCLILADFKAFAQGGWVDISSGLKEIDIQSVAADPGDPLVIFAGSEKNLYRSPDQGRTWKTVFNVSSSENRIYCLFVDSSEGKVVYLGTGEGIYRSEDGGKRFGLFFNSVKSGSKQTFCIAKSPFSPKEIWAGTGDGLIAIDKRSRIAKKIDSLPNFPVYSLATENLSTGSVFAATQKGIFKSADKGSHWKKVYSSVDVREEEAESSSVSVNNQFGLEETANIAAFSGLISMPSQDKFYAASKNGILQGAVTGDSWQPMKDQNIPSRQINAVTASKGTFYAATNKGVFRWDANKENFSAMYKGLLSEEVRTVFYSVSGDYLLVGTKRGIFKWIHPETDGLDIQLEQDRPKETVRPQDLFKNEPTIREIQEAAIRYAEVHPGKIEEWRMAASRKALLPTVSMIGKLATDRNVDIDRGGTADVDKFIIGPENKSFDWSIGLSWNLGDLIWNDDQTSIDSRSKLMVELRDDILNEATHLYFERRRLQIDLLSAVNPDVLALTEKEIRLEELTAGIDALTGGYLSSKLKGRPA